MDIFKSSEVERLKGYNHELFEKDVLNILNGQYMYDEFKRKALMNDVDYLPFNEAMCRHSTINPVFSHAFVRERAACHKISVEKYVDKVMSPLEKLFKKNYQAIVLWFGVDMFCQMNLLTILAYLEQTAYSGKVFLNHFIDDEFEVTQTELELGGYAQIYEDLLINQTRPSVEAAEIMTRAINIYLNMLNDKNPVTDYIAAHIELPRIELVKNLLAEFPDIGYGDTQYLEMIDDMK